MPTTAIVFDLRSISSITDGSFIINPQHLITLDPRWLHIQIVVAAISGRAATLGQQVAAQERLEVTVENLVRVAHFHLGAVVLDDAIGLQYIRPNLRSKVDLEL